MNSYIILKKPEDSNLNPINFPNCPVIILIASPLRYPFKIGLERKFARNPSLKKPPAMHNNPTTTASKVEKALYSGLPATATETRADETNMHVAESGPIMSCLEVPNNA